jgi:hypothetical protein
MAKEAVVARVPKKNPPAGQSEAPRAPRRDRRGGGSKASSAEIAAEAASIYPDTFETPPSPDEIAAEAYAIYQSRGGDHGRHEDDWHEAERRLTDRRKAQQRR